MTPLEELAWVADLEKKTPSADSVLISNRVLQGSAAEISALKEKLKEAREIIEAAQDYLSCDWFPHKSRNGNDKAAIKARARAFLTVNNDG